MVTEVIVAIAATVVIVATEVIVVRASSGDPAKTVRGIRVKTIGVVSPVVNQVDRAKIVTAASKAKDAIVVGAVGARADATKDRRAKIAKA